MRAAAGIPVAAPGLRPRALRPALAPQPARPPCGGPQGRGLLPLRAIKRAAVRVRQLVACPVRRTARQTGYRAPFRALCSPLPPSAAPRRAGPHGSQQAPDAARHARLVVKAGQVEQVMRDVKMHVRLVQVRRRAGQQAASKVRQRAGGRCQRQAVPYVPDLFIVGLAGDRLAVRPQAGKPALQEQGCGLPQPVPASSAMRRASSGTPASSYAQAASNACHSAGSGWHTSERPSHSPARRSA